MNNLILSPLSLESLTEAVAVRVIQLWILAEKKQLSENQRYSIKEAASRNSLSEGTIRNYIKEGKIKAHKIGRRILIDESQFEEGLSEVKSLKYKR